MKNDFDETDLRGQIWTLLHQLAEEHGFQVHPTQHELGARGLMITAEHGRFLVVVGRIQDTATPAGEEAGYGAGHYVTDANRDAEWTGRDCTPEEEAVLDREQREEWGREAEE